MLVYKSLFSCLFLFVTLNTLYAQPLDLLIRGGRVIDPRNKIDSVLDVGIADGKIVEVSEDIRTERAGTVVDASGLIRNTRSDRSTLTCVLWYGTERLSEQWF